jgi:pimeloyl-ACP methyl ester carboxylesterase
MRFARIAAISVAALALAGVAAWKSGDSPAVDEVARAAERIGLPLESRRLDVGEIELHAVLAGPEDGPPVLLLHGYPEFWYSWHGALGALARAGFRVAAPDLRGYNRSDKPPGAGVYTDLHYEQDAIGLLDALGWDTANLAGHDVGGGTAWRLVFSHPERFRRAVVFNVGHPLAWAQARPQDDPDTVSWWRAVFRWPFVPELMARAGGWWLHRYYLRSTSRPGTFDDGELAVYRGAWARDGAITTMIHGFRAPDVPLPAIPADGRPPIPVRLVWGERDAFVSREAAALTEAYLPAGEVRTWPDAGHWLLLEEPERVAAEMIEFFGAPR